MATSSWADGAVDETIGSGQDRANIAAFESAHDGETPTNGTTCKGSLTGVDSGTGLQYWSGWVAGQNSTTKIVLTSQSGDEPDGVNDATGSDALVQGQWFLNNANAFYMDFVALEFDVNTTYAMLVTLDGGGILNIAKSVFRDGSGYAVGTSGISSAYTINIGGCLFKEVNTANTYKGVIHGGSSNVDISVINTTIEGASGLWGAIASRATGEVITLKNVALVNNVHDINTSGGTVTTTTTGSEDGEADFTVSFTDAVDFTEPSSDDYTVVESGALDGSGTAVTESWFTTLCPTDLAGTTWGSTPSVGAFEIITTGGTSPLPMIIQTMNQFNGGMGCAQ